MIVMIHKSLSYAYNIYVPIIYHKMRMAFKATAKQATKQSPHLEYQFLESYLEVTVILFHYMRNTCKEK